MTKQVLLSFDVEEFDAPLEFGQAIAPEVQFEVSSRGLARVLEVLDRLGVAGTFFTTANYAEQYPQQVRRIAQGHEVASHGFYHSRFEPGDLAASRQALERVSGQSVVGFRRARMAATDLKLVAQAGYRYDASENPIWLPGRYNNFFKARTAHVVEGVVAIPASATPLVRLPLFWLSFKNLPLPLIRAATRWTLAADGYVSLYFHPWEFADLAPFALPGYMKRRDGVDLLRRLERYLQWLQRQGRFTMMRDFERWFRGQDEGPIRRPIRGAATGRSARTMNTQLAQPQSMPPVEPRSARERRGRVSLILAWGVWIGLGVAVGWIALHSARHGQSHATVANTYRLAARNWVHGRDLYDLSTIEGFLYFPQSAILTVPFALLPDTAAEVAWRLCGIAVLAWAMWRFAGLITPTVAGRFTRAGYFLLLTLLTAPTAAGSANSGQMNIMMAATMVLGMLEVARGRWGWATLWLVVGVALKPQVLILVLLVAVLYRPMRWRAVLGMLVLAVLPLLAQRPQFAWHQYVLCFQKMGVSGNPVDKGGGRHFCDLVGLLWSVGLEVPFRVQTALRVVAALATLGLCARVVRRWDTVHAAAGVLALAAGYLMLFNPRTEGGSYVVAAVPLSAFAAWAFLVDGAAVAGWTLTALSVGWVASYDISRGLWLAVRRAHGIFGGVPPAERAFDYRYWLAPALAVVFVVYVTHLVWSDRWGAKGRAANGYAPGPGSTA
jgi:peptidoglycan/xylan/chitin deacetylase (PgdA/CDA1 family)